MVAGPGRNEFFTQDRIAADLDLNELWPPRNKEGSDQNQLLPEND